MRQLTVIVLVLALIACMIAPSFGAAKYSAFNGVKVGANGLKIGNTSDYNKFTIAGTTGNTAIAGTLAVTGAATLNGGLNLGATSNIAVNTNKFTVAAASGNTVLAGTLTLGASSNIAVNTNKFTVAAASGNTLVAGTLAANGGFTCDATAFSVADATGVTKVQAVPVVCCTRHRVTVAEINAGHELLPAVAGASYRLISCKAIAYGGAVGTTTTVDLLGTQSAGSVKLVTYAQANLTRSTVLTDTSTGATVLADGASYAPCDANTAITANKTGGAADTATGVDFILTYTLE